MRWLPWKPLLAAITCVLICAATCEACPTCKQAMADGPHHEQVVRGYFWSILFMMSMPFLILSGLGLYFYSLVRAARAGAIVDSGSGLPKTLPAAD